MDTARIANLFDRVAYYRKALHDMGGEGTSWSCTFPNGETHRYVLGGLKSPGQIEHDASTVAVWLWSLKDYLKSRAASLGKCANEVEAFASADPSLALCADLANSAKHGSLTTSRSGKWPRIGTIAYSVPQSALAELKIGLFFVGIEVADPTLVEVSLPILDSTGTQIGDTFTTLERALSAWESLAKDLNCDLGAIGQARK